MTLRHVGVVGAGVIGVGVAQSLAESGHDVVLVDVDDARLDDARRRLDHGLRLRRLMARQPGQASASEVLRHIDLTFDDARLARAEVVIENVTESWDIKRQVHARLDAIVAPTCVVAANTSTISISQLAGVGRYPARVVGMHFMNPVPLKKTVEVIRGAQTSDEALAVARALLRQMGKELILVGDSPGFVSNRVLMLAINEAISLLQERVATVEAIDDVFRDCCGHAMGPLETADLIGLDTILLSLDRLHEAFGDAKFMPCALLRQMVDAGRCGRKTGNGFYSYAT